MDKGDRKVLNKSIGVLLIVVAVFVILLLVAGKKGTKVGNFAGNLGQSAQEVANGQAIVNIGGKQLVAQVADSPAKREKGLSGTNFLNEKSGMLFVFEEVGDHGFWMKDMKIPISIIWTDEFGTIVHIEENVQPESYPKVFTSPVPAKYVLEVSAGYTERNEIEVGDMILVTPIQGSNK